ncbi:MAG TPA: putative glycoside hydrolase [Noviherbaspirillum sp.]|nr:putative glycoside hydrolase [Noviherbaspirillum sp.]
MRLLLFLLVLVTAASSFARGGADERLTRRPEPGFPRLLGMQIGEKHYDDPDYQRQMARLDIVILGFYRGWGERPGAMREVVRELRRLNPSILVGQYTILNEASNDADNTAEQDKQAALRENGWWLTTAAGKPVQWTEIYGAWDINITAWTRKDRNGLRYPQWLALRDHRVYFEPVPEFDIWFFDNVMHAQRIRLADWRGSGRNQSGTDPEVQRAFRRAQAEHWAAARRLSPHRLFIGNTDNDLSYPEFRNRLQGAFLETLMGESWSLYERLGWNAMMTRYHSVFNNLAAPRIVSFNVWGAADDYRLMRFALASCLMNDGYFSYTDQARGYSSVPWFDEYDARLGRAIDPPQRSPWKNGVYRRRFEHGLVLVNPTRETRRVDIGPGYRHLRGEQAPQINSGRAVSSIELAPQDGVLLLSGS